MNKSLRKKTSEPAALPSESSNGFQPDLSPRVDTTLLSRSTARLPFRNGRPTFANPIIPSPSADPWVIEHNGTYFYCESRNQDSIYIRSASCFTTLGMAEGRKVWSAPKTGPNCNAVWAPELHRLNGKWYIYYAADGGLNENHRMFVLEGTSDDPMGEYICRGELQTDGWAIDGTVLTMENGQLYFIWSGWPGKVNGQQNLYIAPMRNPWTLSSHRMLLTTPDRSWEQVDMAICEGPQVLKKNGKLFIIYSASGSWSVDYCLGMLVFRGGDILNRSNWEKVGPVFHKTDFVYGVGHCSFVQSQDESEDWIVYHVKSKVKKGWNDRNVHAQRFTWDEKGFPHFGSPIRAGALIEPPSMGL